IFDQLDEGGRLVAVVRSAGIGRAALTVRQAGILASRTGFDASISGLPGFELEPAFVFLRRSPPGALSLRIPMSGSSGRMTSRAGQAIGADGTNDEPVPN